MDHHPEHSTGLTYLTAAGEIRTERGVGRYIDRPTHAPYYDAVQKRRELDAPSAVDRM